jgi:hypothetical protein
MGKTLKIKIMPKFEKSTGYKMKGFSGFGNSPAKDMKTGKYEHSFESPAKQYKEKTGPIAEKYTRNRETKEHNVKARMHNVKEIADRAKHGKYRIPKPQMVQWPEIPNVKPPKLNDPSPTKQKKNQQKVVGEQTGLIKTDKKGQKYVLQDYDTDYGMMKGDTIQLSPDAPIVDGYLIGGDYYGKETKESKKRKKGPKTYKVNIEK